MIDEELQFVGAKRLDTADVVGRHSVFPNPRLAERAIKAIHATDGGPSIGPAPAPIGRCGRLDGEWNVRRRGKRARAAGVNGVSAPVAAATPRYFALAGFYEAAARWHVRRLV